MNISIENEQQLAPRAAILVYQNSSSAAAILHEIKDDGGLSVGRNLDMATLEEIFRSANGKSRLGYLPANILALKHNSVVWFEKSRKRPIFFETTESNRRKLNKLSGREVIWPTLLFKVQGGQLNCWALRSNRRPEPRTELYVTPLTHINETDGHVCLPSGMRLRHGVSPLENMSLVSESFYNGIFGHGTGSMNQINHPRGHDGFWLEHLRKQPEKFPAGMLKKANCRLEDILR